jgi:hypothetical protein
MLPKADGKRNPSKRLIFGVAMIANRLGVWTVLHLGE